MSNDFAAEEYFSTISKIPHEFLSKKARKILNSAQAADSVDFVKNINSPDTKNRNPLQLLLSCLKQAQNPEFLTKYASELRKTLPLLLNAPDIFYTSNTQKDLCSKILKAADKYMEEEQYISLILKRIKPKLTRSDVNINLREDADIDEEQLIKNIIHDVNICYSRFSNELSYISYPLEATPTCREVLAKIVLSDYWIYPVLPVIFALDAIYQSTQKQKRSKADLLCFDLKLPDQDCKIHTSKALYHESLRLIRDIKRMLSDILEPVYMPMLLPKPSKTNRSYFGDIDPNVLFERDDMQKNSDDDKFSSHKDFVLPICHTNQLALDLSSFVGLTFEQTLTLQKKLPSYLIDAQYGENEVKKQYNDIVWEIIKVFRVLAKPETYYTGNSFAEMLKQEVNAVSTSAKEFFQIQEANSNTSICIYEFANKYFHYVTISEGLFFHAAQCPPLSGGEELLPKYYKKLLESFQEYAEEKYIKIDALEKYLRFPMDALHEVKSPVLRKSVRKMILQATTVQDALTFLENHLQTPPKSRYAVKQYIMEYLRKHELQKVYQARGDLSDGQKFFIYQMLLRQALDVLGHQAVTLLQMCYSELSKAENSA